MHIPDGLLWTIVVLAPAVGIAAAVSSVASSSPGSPLRDAGPVVA